MSREGQQSAGAPSVGGDLGRPSAATGQEATDPVFAAEQAHLSETYDKLEKIGRDAIAAMEAVARDAAEDKKSMAEELAVNFATWDDILETHADIVAMNNIIEAHDMANSVQAERLRAVEVLLREPYFAKIALQFKEGHPAKELYIGSAGISDENYRRLVVDWRSPVAEVYYNQTMGPTSYVADGRTIHVDLQLRRQFEIEEDRLITYFDSDVAIEDKLLLASLSRGRSAHMQAITATIQREQNAVIRDEAPGTLIIQGVAGSGKTSIALHRVAYLLYRQKERLTSQSVAILSPSRVFSDYISGVLPELGEEPVRQWSLHDLAALLLEGITKVAPPVSAADEADPVRAARAAAKGTEAFAASLTAWLGAQLGEKGSGDGKVAASELFEPRDLAVGGDVAEASWLAERFAAYAPVPFDERLDLIAGDALELAHGKTFGRYAHTMPTRRELRGRLLRMMRAKNPLALYKRFLADTGQSALFKAPAKGVVEWEDAFLVVLCALAFAGPDGFAPTSAVRHLVIDEMQDLTPVQHEAISRLFRCDRTILGDVNQLVDGRAVSAPEAVAAHYPGARVVRLMTSYRSTSEITELAARVMPVAGLVAVQRHGEAVRFARCGDTVGVLAAVDEAIERWRASGRRTLGVIAKSDFLAARYAELIARDHDLTLLTDETDAYPGGIVVSSVRLAKGLEFDEAVLLDADDRQYATEADRNLLYVAVTRAMHALTVLYRDEPSPFLGGAVDRYSLRPSR